MTNFTAHITFALILLTFATVNAWTQKRSGGEGFGILLRKSPNAASLFDNLGAGKTVARASVGTGKVKASKEGEGVLSGLLKKCQRRSNRRAEKVNLPLANIQYAQN